jgi:rfaE bifunctional protein kinase chain/domain/rfaE bifunctional protein nucleotidyltransferase chain/domain
MNDASVRRKIFTLPDLAQRLEALRQEGRTIVLCHGVFDLLHIGHIRYFEAARKFGDVLVVTLTPDVHVNKGPHRPAFNQELRAEALAALDYVDFVAVNQWPTAVETIALLRPQVYAKGAEYRDPAQDKTGKIVDEARAVAAVGGTIKFTEDITFSSSTLINRHCSPFSSNVQRFLTDMAARHGVEALVSYLERGRALKVLVVGETIIDEYHYCDTLGKSGKEPILAVKYLESQKFAGGVLAIANHLAAFSDQVELVSFLGTVDSQEEFIREKLHPAVKTRFIYQEGAPTIVKRRFLESYPLQKLFEVYVMNGCEETAENSRRLRAELEDLLPAYDLVVVADYGHGMLDAQTIALLCAKAKFLAVNVQVNAGNLGFNTISKYPRADFISISEKEIRLEARSRVRPIEDIVRDVAARLSCTRMLITQGKQGCLCFDGQDFIRIPAFTDHIVDRVGAGDTVLAVASMCVSQGAPMDVAGFIGNAAGAQAVAMVCNENALDRVQLVKHIVSLLK